FSGPASAVIPGVGVISKKNMEWKWNNEKTVGSDIEFFERKQADGSVRRYAVAGDIGHGFDIYDITNPDMPTLAGVYVSPGLQWQGDVQVNPRRNIVSFATDNLGASLAHGGGIGIELVDITNIASPQRLGVVSNVGGAHNSTIINDQYIYTALPTHIIDYSDPRNPKNLGQVPFICGHDLTVDPNRPDRLYSACSSGNKWQIVDISDPATPKLIADVKDTQISIAHQADPAPDSSFVIVSDERGGGISHHRCPGGGGHVYDISGKYVAGASETTPKKMGVYFAPFTGTSSGGSSGQWANCTMHNFTFQAERFAFSVGWYSAGSFVADLQEATKTSGGLYQEYAGPDASVPGKTTWGNTLGNILLEGDEVWSTKWTRFDDPLYDRYLFTNGLTRGVDTLKYTGPLPLKVARLTVDGQAPGGVVSGVLDRYAVWTYEGWVNKPLAGKTLQITAGGTTVEATTGADGSFSAATGLLPGTYEVTVTWPGDQDYQPATVTRQITAS
ncbi:MAG TPA: hypothetical protein VG602_07470, partial [Actinomycetota bacterium]|nr:hypothetical protein [Actinomycetota bacterium]